MDKHMRRSIQRILQGGDWPALEAFLERYMKETFLQTSIKKNTDFDTMWYAAFSEGGKHHLIEFFNRLEHEAHLADE